MSNDPIRDVAEALRRMAGLFTITDREHTHGELLGHFAGIVHEHQTAVEALRAIGEDITAPRPGSARSGDPETSKAAARAIRTRSGSQRHQILLRLAQAGDGLTDPEMQADLVMVESSQRTRRHELCQAGYVQVARVALADDGLFQVPVTRPRELTGQECLVWEITDKGTAALRKLEAGQTVMEIINGELAAHTSQAVWLAAGALP